MRYTNIQCGLDSLLSSRVYHGRNIVRVRTKTFIYSILGAQLSDHLVTNDRKVWSPDIQLEVVQKIANESHFSVCSIITENGKIILNCKTQ